ncbi:MAG: rRNA maturation RNase YbeY [Paludibacter sp.]|nr:rRNA maturation RNase YbeY [Paludibacter sp.]
MIQYITEEVASPKFDKRRTNNWIKDVARLHGHKTGDIAYIFCNDERILEVNRQYLQHDYYTDIITFDYSDEKTISGDIFISLDTVKSNAEEFDIPFLDELNRILIHGILHLCGHDDKTPELRIQMTNLENEALDLLKKQ